MNPYTMLHVQGETALVPPEQQALLAWGNCTNAARRRLVVGVHDSAGSTQRYSHHRGTARLAAARFLQSPGRQLGQLSPDGPAFSLPLRRRSARHPDAGTARTQHRAHDFFRRRHGHGLRGGDTPGARTAGGGQAPRPGRAGQPRLLQRPRGKIRACSNATSPPGWPANASARRPIPSPSASAASGSSA